MNELEWIIDTPTDDYEYGETLYFRDDLWAYYTGQFIRQVGEDITIKITEVRWGIEDSIGTEKTFNSKYLTEELNICSLFTVIDDLINQEITPQ